MATKTYTVKFVGSVTPKKTNFLDAKTFKMDFEGELELDEADGAKIDTIRKAFQNEMQNRLKKQLGHLDDWLKQKDALIATMVKKYEDIKKFGFPTTANEAKALEKKNQALEEVATETQALVKDYKQIVEDWAKNAREQQGLISMMTALKKARTETISNKRWRVGLGIAIKAVLVVAAIALTIAAIVLTAGATAPIFVGLAAAGLVLSGTSGIVGVGVAIKKNASMEKKILKNVQNDVKKIAEALKPIEGKKSDIAKHITELLNVMKVRVDSLKKIEMSVKEKKAQIKGYESQLSKLESAIGQQKPPDKNIVAEIASRKKKVEALKKQINSLDSKTTQMNRDNQDAQALIDELKAMNVELDKISGQSANTILGNLKARFTSVDGWIELSNDVGGLVSGISGVHA
jgi:chromosome segregation ATPase